MSASISHIIGAVITALIILAGLYTVLRNFTLFLVDGLRGLPGVAWYNRPYLFRAIAVTATLFWLFGPFYGKQDSLHLPTDQQRFVLFALYVLAAAAGLWVLRIGFWRSIPAAMRPLRTNQPGFISWGTLAAVSYLIQLTCAITVGLLFAFAPGGTGSWPVRIAVFAILLISGYTSLWRMSYLAGPDNDALRSQMEQAFGGRPAAPPAVPPTPVSVAPPADTQP
ncbi:MAG: hypothetical protein H0X24_18215 [Ktedonobacterales bacterium]|nr:hypothetical protein [Ktedonobacterales bacterium]